MFPPRTAEHSPPGYDELKLPIRLNITSREYDDLLAGSTADEDKRAQLGRALAAVYQGATVTAYGMAFDFSTPEAAVATLMNDALPGDLRLWLRNAPIVAIDADTDFLLTTFRASLTPGS